MQAEARAVWHWYGMENLPCHKSQRILTLLPVRIGD